MDNPSNLARLSQVAGQAKQQQGTGYTNLGKLVQANLGNQLGQKVAGNVQSQIGNVQNQLGQQQQQFQTESEKNKVGSDADITKRNEVINRFAPASGSDVGSGRSDATASAPSDQDVTAFQRFTSGQYTGPQGLQDTSTLQTSANQLKNQVSNFSPSGTQELLRRSVGGNRYTQGQQRLDTLLMDKSALTPVQRQASTLGQQIQRADVAASGQAELNKNQAQQFATETGGLLDTGMKGIYNVDASGKATGQVGTALANAQQAETTRQELLGKLQAAGTDSSVAGLSKLQQLLQEGGVNQTDMQKVFGSSNVAEEKDRVQNAFDKLMASVNGVNGFEFLNSAGLSSGRRYVTDRAADILSTGGQNIMYGVKDRIAPQYNEYKALRDNSVLGRQLEAGIYGDYLSDGYSARQNSNIEGKLGDIAPSLLKSILAKSSAVGSINPTAQGVATDAQIANYNALNKLMGKTSSNLQTRVAQQNLGKDIVDANGNPVYAAGLGPYQAGKIGFDPNQL